MIIDASVAIKWFVTDDPLHAQSVSVVGAQRLSAPTLLLAEVANGLWKYARTGRLARDDVLHATSLLPLECRLIGDGELIASAQQLSLDFDHAIYDCLYAALAIREDLPFLTADGRFARKFVGAPGLHVIELSSV